MSQVVDTATPVVSPEEVARRIQEYRRLGHLRQAPAQVVYPDAAGLCPWPDCGLRIAGIRFELERMGDASQVTAWLAAWWNGPGLVARCPKCKRPVLFDVTGKQAIAEPVPPEYAVLPQDWHKVAHLVVLPA
jgi:hypothetical protein